MEVSMRALLELRAQAVSAALPQDQLRRVRRTAVFTIDKGNRYEVHDLISCHLTYISSPQIYKQTTRMSSILLHPLQPVSAR